MINSRKPLVDQDIYSIARVDKKIKKLLGLYSDSITVGANGDKVLIRVALSKTLPSPENAHVEIINQLSKNGFRIIYETLRYNTFTREEISYIESMISMWHNLIKMEEEHKQAPLFL